MIHLLVLGLLFYESIIDIRKMRVHTIPLGIAGALGIIINYICYEKNWLWMLSGACIGVLLLIVSMATNEKIGYGDGILFLTLGLCLGFKSSLMLLWGAFVIAGIAGGVIMVARKKSKGMQLPFFPCVMLSFFASLIIKNI